MSSVGCINTKDVSIHFYIKAINRSQIGLPVNSLSVCLFYFFKHFPHSCRVNRLNELDIPPVVHVKLVLLYVYAVVPMCMEPWQSRGSLSRSGAGAKASGGVLCFCSSLQGRQATAPGLFQRGWIIYEFLFQASLLKVIKAAVIISQTGPFNIPWGLLLGICIYNQLSPSCFSLPRSLAIGP